MEKFDSTHDIVAGIKRYFAIKDVDTPDIDIYMIPDIMLNKIQILNHMPLLVYIFISLVYIKSSFDTTLYLNMINCCNTACFKHGQYDKDCNYCVTAFRMILYFDLMEHRSCIFTTLHDMLIYDINPDIYAYLLYLISCTDMPFNKYDSMCTLCGVCKCDTMEISANKKTVVPAVFIKYVTYYLYISPLGFNIYYAFEHCFKTILPSSCIELVFDNLSKYPLYTIVYIFKSNIVHYTPFSSKYIDKIVNYAGGYIVWYIMHNRYQHGSRELGVRCKQCIVTLTHLSNILFGHRDVSIASKTIYILSIYGVFKHIFNIASVPYILLNSCDIIRLLYNNVLTCNILKLVCTFPCVRKNDIIYINGILNR